MKPFSRFLISALAAISCTLLHAARGEAGQRIPVIPKVPKVGLVLSGGGANGAAHVGVLKALEENGIKVDYIVGTSMGAIIGGLYATGYSASEIDSLMRTQDWDFLMSDKVPRSEVSFEEKEMDETYLLSVPFSFHPFAKVSEEPPLIEEDIIGPMPMPMPMQKAVRRPFSFLDRIPMEMVGGQNIYNLFSRLTVGYQDSMDFNMLPIPFSCVAVDLISGNEVDFHSGRLVDAIRASMSIPGYFAPVKMDDMVLIDGGAKNNYPTDVARSMGADFIIGVTLGEVAEKSATTDITNIAAMVDRIYHMYTKTKLNEQLEDTDILIHPSTSGFSTLSFNKESIAQLIDNGYNAALKQTEALRNLKNHIDESRRLAEMYEMGPAFDRSTLVKKVDMSKDSILISEITYSGIDDSTAELLLRGTRLHAGGYLSGDDIDEAIKHLYNTMAFKSVSYTLEGTREPYRMHIRFVGGHNSEVRLGARIDNEEISSILLNIALNNKALYGSSLNFLGDLSVDPKASLRYSYSFPSNVRLNVEGVFRYSDTQLFDIENDYNLRFLSNTFSTYLSTRKYSNIYTRAGVSFASFRKERMSGYELIPDHLDWDRHRFLYLFFASNINSLNDEYFPTAGWQASWSGEYHLNLFNSGSGRPFSVLQADVSTALTAGRLTFQPAVAFRYVLAEKAPFAFMNIMGGYLKGRYMEQQIPFIGFRHAIPMRNLLNVASADVRMRLRGRHYLVASAAYAVDGNKFSDFFERDGILGLRLGYACATAIGPLSLNIHWSDRSHNLGSYVSLGYTF